jgi:alcohol dehydrogenase
MDNFIFQNSTKIIFGRDTENKVGKETTKYSRNILLHYGGGSIKKSGLYQRVISSLKESRVKFTELSGVKPNPVLTKVREGINICRKNKIDFILAVGGGSVIDSAKAIAVGIDYEGDVWDFYDSEKEIKDAVPIGVVLTIPAAGSEASTGSVITNEDGLYKRYCNSLKLRPKFSILNPILSFTLPAFQTACGAADIIAHITERYFTNTLKVDLTDRLCEATLKTVINNIPIALRKPEDYDSRAEIMWSGTIAHNDLLGTGRVSDWGSHDIEHELSAIYDLAHGEGLAIIVPAWMKYVFKTNLARFVQFAVRVFNVDQNFESVEKTAMEGINRLEEFFKESGLPTRLKDVGISDDRFDEMASKCTEKKEIGNFKKLNKEDVLKILNLAL